jgi:succinyl-diaminopimelate desuccinylase
MPDMGVNAIEMLAECISLFKGKCAEVLKNVHPVLGKPSVSTTMMHGGMHCNIVPKDCTAVVDIRTTSRKEHEAFLAALKQATAEAGEAYGGSVTYEIVNERPALETPANTRLIQTLGQKLRAVGKKPEHIGVAYYTDLSGLMDGSDKPFAIVGPGHQSMMHKEDEYITISDIVTMAEVYVDYILSK